MVGAKPDLAAEAARIAKADLQSAMVGEFPELQGTMGVYYAKAAGLPEAVADACKAHYQPLGPSDAVPTEPISVAVALADKIDTLTGFWAIDEKPTGSKDPFALRRAALGVIRLVLGNGLRLELFQLFAIPTFRHTHRDEIVREKEKVRADPEGYFAKHLPPVDEDAPEPVPARNASPEEVLAVRLKHFPVAMDLIAFFHDRLKVHLRDEGIRHDVIDACLAMPGNDDLTLLVKRAEALSAFLKTDDGENLIQGFKRANNILSQAEEKDGVEYSFGADPKFAEDSDPNAHSLPRSTRPRPPSQPAMKAEDFRRRPCPPWPSLRARAIGRLLRGGAGQYRQRDRPAQQAEPAQPHPHDLPQRRPI